MALGRLALRHGSLLLAVHHYRVGERRDPDHHDEGVDEDGETSAHPRRLEEGLQVRDEDDAADGCAEDAHRKDSDNVRRNGCGDEATDQQRPYHLPGDIREAQGDEEPYARGEGDDELAGVHGAHDLARLHPAGGKEGGRGDRTPPAATRGIQEAGYKTQGPQEPPGYGPDVHRLLVPAERKPGQDVDAEGEEEDRDDGLGSLRRDDRDQDHGPQESPHATRHGQPADLAPIDVAEPPVREPGGSRGADLRYVDARGGERWREPHRQQQSGRRYPVGHA